MAWSPPGGAQPWRHFPMHSAQPAQAVGEDSTSPHPLHKWQTVVSKFTHFIWTEEPSTLYCMSVIWMSRQNSKVLKPFSHTWPTPQLPHTVPLQRKCWSNVHPIDKLREKAQLTPQWEEEEEERGNILRQERAGNSSASGISFAVLAEEENFS